MKNSREVVDALAEKIWDYHHMNHHMKKCDCILALCSNDTRVAERSAELYFQGWAPFIIFSGGVGVLTKNLFNKPEAEVFADTAYALGVPREDILIEPKSTNTGENIQFTRELLKEKGIEVSSFILVQKPYMERRTYATFKKQWPEKECVVSSPEISFEMCATEFVSKEDCINIMVGDMQRIKLYSERGFQIPQDISEDVWQAYEQLVALGYDKHLVRD